MNRKSYPILIWFIVLIVVLERAQAQNINNYAFSSTQGTFIPISGGVTPNLSLGDYDEGYFANIPIGFDFWYQGELVNQVHVSTNGFLGLNSFNQLTSTSSANNNLSSTVFMAANRPYLAPLWDNLDMDTTTGARFSYQTTGVEPNRVFTAEWLNAEWNWFANAPTISFQVKLYESTGVVEYIYNQEAASAFSPTASIGITSAASGNYISLSNAGANPSLSSSVSYNNINSKPASGQIYRFTPPVPNAVSTANVSNIEPTRMQVNWSLVSGAVKYAVYYSTDNNTFVYGGSTTGLSLLVGSLMPSTTYYFRVYALSEGSLSTSPATTSGATINGSLSGTYSIPGNFNSITHALDSIKRVGIGGPIVLELQGNYICTNERFPIVFSDTLGTSQNAPLTVRPASGVTGLVIEAPSNVVASLVFTKARYVTLDGRAGGVGNGKDLTLKVPTNTSAILAYHMANNNILINALRFNASANAQYINEYINLGGWWYYPYYNRVLEENKITISDCEIGDSNIMSTYGIYSAFYYYANTNSTVIVKNNHIFNTGTGNSTYAGAIYSQVYSSLNASWFIEGNHIYNLIPLGSSYNTQAYYGIYSNSHNVSIKNNYIGGSGPYCSGSAFETGPASNANVFYGIYCSSNNNANVASIQGNTIANFFWPGVSTTPWTGIYVNMPLTHIGDSVGNIIGDTLVNTNVYVLSQINSTTPVAYGIRVLGGTMAKIGNNIISGISAGGTNNNYPCSFTGISASNNANLLISNNTIGNQSLSNGVRVFSAVSNYAQQLIGIGVQNTTSGVSNISGNRLYNLTNYSTSSSLQNNTTGILLNVNYDAQVTDNLLYKLASASNNPAINGNPAICGVYAGLVSGKTNISRNKITALQSTSLTTGGRVMGIQVNSMSGDFVEVGANELHSFTTATNTSTTGITGINLQDGNVNVFNNMIRLGIDENGASMNKSCLIAGIQKATSYFSNVHHNTVYIGGTVSGTTNVNTYAYRKSNDGSDELVNNILVNVRTNSTSGGRHYAVSVNSTNSLLSNNNLLQSGGGTYGRLFQSGSTDYNTRTAWFNQTGMDDNSDTTLVTFVNATGNAASVNLRLNAALPTKAEGNGRASFITTDIDGQVRSGLTPVDIGAHAGNFLRVNINPVPVVWTWIKGAVNGKDGLITWKVASQLNNRVFHVQRSFDGKSFTSIGQVKGAGTTGTAIVYNYTDAAVFIGTRQVYYRVVQEDFSGKQSASDVVMVSIDAPLPEIVLWPNPAKQEVNLLLPDAQGDNVEVSINNFAGIMVKHLAMLGKEKEVINVADLPAGVYTVSIYSGKQKPVVKKLIIE